MAQDYIVFAIVGAIGAGWGLRAFRFAVAPRLAEAFLVRGQVKWAMRLRTWGSRCTRH